MRVSLLVALAGCGDSAEPRPPGNPVPVGRPSLDPTYRASGRGAAGDVSVHLFEWKWNDIATECEQVLGPAGFAAVQVSPPQEHSIVPSHDWSQRYQPVSYSMARSRSGTGAEFVSMVNRCKAVGCRDHRGRGHQPHDQLPEPGRRQQRHLLLEVRVSRASTPPADFHAPCALNNYQSAANVQDCELSPCPTSTPPCPSVRQKIADYLIALARLGVAGFRIDAAKHIQQVDLDEILDRVNTTRTADGGRPALCLPRVRRERPGRGARARATTTARGTARAAPRTSPSSPSPAWGTSSAAWAASGSAQLNPDGTQGNRFSEAAWGLMPSDKAVVFLQNHDTQHTCGLGYRNGDTFRLANVWMLAQPYGYPSILSSYAFDCPLGNSMGPPSDAAGNTRDVVCAASLETATVGQWVCEHRDPSIRNMVRFRRVVAGTNVNHWWDNGANAIAFTRGDKGFVAINGEASAVAAIVTTGLPPGTYCDLITGGLVGLGMRRYHDRGRCRRIGATESRGQRPAIAITTFGQGFDGLDRDPLPTGPQITPMGADCSSAHAGSRSWSGSLFCC